MQQFILNPKISAPIHFSKLYRICTHNIMLVVGSVCNNATYFYKYIYFKFCITFQCKLIICLHQFSYSLPKYYMKNISPSWYYFQIAICPFKSSNLLGMCKYMILDKKIVARFLVPSF